MSETPVKNPIFVALDVDDSARAVALASETAPFVGGLKVGPRLMLRTSPEWFAILAKIHPIFIDMKFHDIPSTMEAAVKSAFDLGATFATVHAASGKEALTRLAQFESAANQSRYFKILAVTVLTSYSEETRPPHWKNEPLANLTQQLTEQVFASGLTGVVCSPQETLQLRKKFPRAFIVNPGIRGAKDSAGDQARVATPLEALGSGANMLVVGRPIVEAANPGQAAESIFNEIKSWKH